MDNIYKPVIGLEIHIELKTRSKMFCDCSADWFGKAPNTNTCPVCLGLPGALPVPNKMAIEWAITLGIALGCKVNMVSKFDRKHYFYPDLPKGYQISQYDKPFTYDGSYTLLKKNGERKRIGITRVHLEEDTGKLIHRDNETLIDFNRSGVPLVEIVTEPDFDNTEDMKQFLEELQTIVRYIGISDADMEKGSMRLEPNISVRKIGEKGLPDYKVEVKNINSFRFAKLAADYEIKRHIRILNNNETPVQETRGFDEKKKITQPQRVKEESHDYRYFPEPDIPPFTFKTSYIENIRKNIPELPHEKIERFVEKYDMKYACAYTLTRSIKRVRFFESVIEINEKEKNNKETIREIANTIINKKINTSIEPKEFIKIFYKQRVSFNVDVNQLEKIVHEIIENNIDAVNSYKKGKKTVIMYLVGQVMKEMRGKAHPEKVREYLEKKLSE